MANPIRVAGVVMTTFMKSVGLCLVVATAMGFGLASCGLSAKKPAIDTSASLSEQQNVPCTEANCPISPLQIVSSQGNYGMAFKAAERNQIQLQGSVRFAPSRQVGIQVLSGLQNECKWSGQGSSTVGCSWSPDVVEGEGVVNLVVRDISRCVFLLKPKGEQAYCNDMSKDMSSLEVEVKLDVPWRVVDSDISQIDQGFFQNQSPKKGANAGLSGCAAGAVQGLLGGSILSSIFGCVGGAIMPLGQTQDPVSNGYNPSGYNQQSIDNSYGTTQ